MHHFTAKYCTILFQKSSFSEAHQLFQGHIAKNKRTIESKVDNNITRGNSWTNVMSCEEKRKRGLSTRKTDAGWLAKTEIATKQEKLLLMLSALVNKGISSSRYAFSYRKLQPYKEKMKHIGTLELHLSKHLKCLETFTTWHEPLVSSGKKNKIKQN